MDEHVPPGLQAIAARPLTAEAFAPYGQVLQGTGPVTERKEFASRMQNGRPHAKPNMTYMKVLPASGRVLVRAVERHPFSNQTFVPLNGTRHLVAVCPSAPDGSPVVERLEVFVASGSQAVNYDANVWHAPRTALSAPGEFVMFRWDDGGAQDTELMVLTTPVAVELAEL
jgi:ureidoglycolate lyase